MIRLVILDMYGTIVGKDYNTNARKGFREFMQKIKNIKKAIATDFHLTATVHENLKGLRILDEINRVYTYYDLIEIRGYEGKRKNLKNICSELGVKPDEAIFISDAEIDHEDAKRDGIKFVHVPFYEKRDENFSFDMIDLSKDLPAYLDLRNVNRE
jgi:FMN phosphatase YigB (HAD superfamily)